MNTCWPNALQTQLLIASLDPGPRALAAWENWVREADIHTLEAGSYGLLPVLYKNLYPRVSHPLVEQLKGVYRKAWFKNNLLQHRAFSVLAALQDAGIPALVLKGIPLALNHYPEQSMRAMQDVDILVPFQKREEAASMLARLGWRCVAEDIRTRFENFQGEEFRDADGHRLDLHWNLSRYHSGPEADREFWEAAVPLKLQSRRFLTLRPEDLLLHVCLHGMRRADEPVPPFRWLADAYRIIVSTPGLDWNRILSTAQTKDLGLPLKDTLFFLHARLDLPLAKPLLRAVHNLPVSSRQRFFFDSVRHPPAARDRIRQYWHEAQKRNTKGAVYAPSFFAAYLKKLWGAQTLFEVFKGGFQRCLSFLERKRDRRKFFRGLIEMNE